MRVEVDLFSGRPNPTWELNQAEMELLWEGIQKLRPGPELTERQGLGFRGFVLADPATGRRIVVYRGTVWSHDRAGVTCYEDDSRALETALLEQARARLDPALFEILAQQVEAGQP